MPAAESLKSVMSQENGCSVAIFYIFFPTLQITSLNNPLKHYYSTAFLSIIKKFVIKALFFFKTGTPVYSYECKWMQSLKSNCFHFQMYVETNP